MVIILCRPVSQKKRKRRILLEAERIPSTSGITRKRAQDQIWKIMDSTQQTQVKRHNNFKAGSLSDNIEFWKTITGDQYILSAVEGYELEFSSSPEKLYNNCIQQQFSNSESTIITLEIDKLIKIGVIKQVSPVDGQILSPIFLTDKKDGSKRMILNLKALNKYMVYEHFKMENIYKAMELMTKDCFLASVDLEKAYYSVSIAEIHRKYLRFKFEGKVFEYCCLPNGLSTAPRLFTKLMRVLFSELRKDGHMSVMYIDDSLLVADNKQDCIRGINDTIDILKKAGFCINWEKSMLAPCHRIEFLGFVLSSSSMRIYVSEDKLGNLKQKLIGLYRPRITIRDISSAIGTIISILPAFTYGKLHYRRLEKCKMDSLQASNGNFDVYCTLTPGAHEDIEYWLNTADQEHGMMIDDPVPTHTIFTDASLSMWGVCFGDIRIGENWTNDELHIADSNINILELLAIKHALIKCLSSISSSTVLFRSDNTTAVSYINNMGGHGSYMCDQIARDVWKIAQDNKIFLTCAYLAGSKNVQADFMSRLSDVKNTEWSLNNHNFDIVTKEFGLPDIDLFASRSNHKCKKYVCWFPDKEAFTIDAFSINWCNLGLLYVFPPFSLLGKVLKKAVRDKCNNNMILIYPQWEAQVWFPQLLKLVKRSIRLTQNPFTKLHPMGKHLRLRCGLI